MPGPAVYVAVAVGTVVTIYAFKEFVLPHIAPRLEHMRDELHARANARRQRRRNVPLAAHDPFDSDSDTDQPNVRPPPSHELRPLGSTHYSNTSSSGRQTGDTSNLRLRTGAHSSAPQGSGTSVEHAARDGLIDAQLEDGNLQAPLVPSPNPWAAPTLQNDTLLPEVGSSKSSPSQNPFQLGSETPTLASTTPPRVRNNLIESLTLEASVYSPMSTSPSGVHLQLPTPSPSASSSSSPRIASISPERLEPAVSSTHLDVYSGGLAPGMSRETTMTMAESFVTADSTGTEFRSLPVTEPTSPFTETSFLSADDDEMTVSSIASSEDLLFVPPGQEQEGQSDSFEDFTEDPFGDPFLGLTPMRNTFASATNPPVPESVGGSDSEWGHVIENTSSNSGSQSGHRDDESSSEGSSEGSWQEVGSLPTSPKI